MMTYRACIPVAVIMFVFASFGCATTLDRAPVGMPVEIAHDEGINNLYQDGQFYFSGQPNEDWIQRMHVRGVTTVINLRTATEIAEQVEFEEDALVESLGMRYVQIPLSPDSFSRDDVDRFARELSKTRGTVLVHCSSSNRSGGMWASYLALHRHMEIEKALERGTAAGLANEPMIEAVQRVISQSSEGNESE